MYMTAAMTGMRQGELLALRWVHVDWVARRIRVRLKAPDLRGL
jgi:integrase